MKDPTARSSAAAVVARLRGSGVVFAEEEASILSASACSASDLEDMVARRCAGEPLEVVVGWAEVAGVRVRTAPGVFVPRRRSECLMRHAIAEARRFERPVVVDLCCGTAILGLAVAASVTTAELHAADMDTRAVAVARTNLGGLGSVHQGDLFEALPDRLRGKVDILIANAPYVPTPELGLLPAEARDHEPAAALDGGVDGLQTHRRILSQLDTWLSPEGRLLIELSPGQTAAARTHAQTSGRAVIREERCDDLGVAVLIVSRGGRTR